MLSHLKGTNRTVQYQRAAAMYATQTRQENSGPHSPSGAPDTVTLSDAASTLSTGIENGFNSAGEHLESGIDIGAEKFRQMFGPAAKHVGTMVSAPLRGSSALVGFVGGTETSKSMDLAADSLTARTTALANYALDRGQEFVQGMGDGASDLVQDIGTAISNPLQTARGIGRLAEASVPLGLPARALVSGGNPINLWKSDLNVSFSVGRSVVDGFKDTHQEHGFMGAVGRGAFELAGTFLTGGAGSGSKVAKVAKVTGKALDAAGNIGLAGQVGVEVANVVRDSTG